MMLTQAHFIRDGEAGRVAIVVALLSACLALAACGGRALDDADIRYAAIGASDAFGFGAMPRRNGYVFRIRDALKERDKDVALDNLGVPAANTDLIGRILRLYLASGDEPDLVTVWVGANDVIDGVDVDDFEDALDDILDDLRDDTSAFIAIANVPDLTELPRFLDRPDPNVTLSRIRAFNEVIADLADDYNVPVVDLFAIMFPDELVSGVDGFHPNNEGHRRIADAFLVVIVAEL